MNRRIAYTSLGIIVLAVMMLLASDTRQIVLSEALVATPPSRLSTQRGEPSRAPETPLSADPDEPGANFPDNLIHIILAGVDSGDTGFEYGRTDSIILVTLDPTSETIKLTSFMRDLYVNIPGCGYSKINAAYAWGGIQLLKETLTQSFGLDLDRHVVIDFSGFASAIDIIGGVDIDVKDYEVPLVESKSAGLQHLDGHQALHYVRIRYAGNSDYERTERQRRLLTAVLQRVRQLPASDYYRLYREIEPYIRVNFSILETLRIGYISYMLRDAEVETLRIPADGTYEATYRDEMAVLVPDLEANIAILNDFLYPAHDESQMRHRDIPVEPSR